ncbi:MAG: hypothetical protein ACREN5_09640 [Gemmatimonadales bacterium]
MTLSPGRAIAYGGLTVGGLDGLDALIFFGLRGVAPARVFQAIAAGLLGRTAAFGGGGATLALGVLLHFTIATTVVAAYYLASRRQPALVRRPLVWGPVYGMLVYLVMNQVVIPLSALGSGSPSLPVVVNGVLIHLAGVGLPAALFASWARSPAAPA